MANGYRKILMTSVYNKKSSDYKTNAASGTRTDYELWNVGGQSIRI